MMKLKITESQAKKSIADYLALQQKLGRCVYVRNNNFVGKFLRPNGSVGWIQNKAVGAADFICLIAGRYVEIEVKSSTGKLSPEQVERKLAVEKLGGLFVEARGIDEIVGLFK